MNTRVLTWSCALRCPVAEDFALLVVLRALAAIQCLVVGTIVCPGQWIDTLRWLSWQLHFQKGSKQ
jgi:hypothetical protein